MSVADAVIASWDTKLNYNLWRPMNAIREGEFDGNPRTAGDPTWQPLINNPPYPDYTSGANVVAGAVTRTLQLFFGRDDIAFSGFSVDTGTRRRFESFSQANAEAIEARIWGGIHFRTADVNGADLGAAVADHVVAHHFRPLE